MSEPPIGGAWFAYEPITPDVVAGTAALVLLAFQVCAIRGSITTRLKSIADVARER